ncbi:MAG: SAP domain-containing protein [Oscillospiraceae bacterium]|nr:SAP domain-containing protein [Oscillospiraceae bacterium]
MENRPAIDSNLNIDIFKSFYYLKEELIAFCRRERLQTTGGKAELTDRIAHYLDTGERLSRQKQYKKSLSIGVITLDSLIEDNFVCSEKHRAFFVKSIGKGFSFNVAFQKWLKGNTGKTYKEAVSAYYTILADKKKEKSAIDRQFEYNTYVRDFFEDNKGRSLDDAIKCWKYKKGIRGHNKYEKSDLTVLD